MSLPEILIELEQLWAGMDLLVELLTQTKPLEIENDTTVALLVL